MGGPRPPGRQPRLSLGRRVGVDGDDLPRLSRLCARPAARVFAKRLRLAQGAARRFVRHALARAQRQVPPLRHGGARRPVLRLPQLRAVAEATPVALLSTVYTATDADGRTLSWRDGKRLAWLLSVVYP